MCFEVVHRMLQEFRFQNCKNHTGFVQQYFHCLGYARIEILGVGGSFYSPITLFQSAMYMYIRWNSEGKSILL